MPIYHRFAVVQYGAYPGLHREFKNRQLLGLGLGLNTKAEDEVHCA